MSDEDNSSGRRSDQARTDESIVGQTTEVDGDGELPDWEDISSDPDLSKDFDYELSEWEQFQTLDGSGQLMFLPCDEELLREDAFVVADEDSLVNLGSNC